MRDTETTFPVSVSQAAERRMIMTEFITRNYGQKEFEVIIKTDSKDHYKQAEEFSRKLIDHAKPQTNADRIRAMRDEELIGFLVQFQEETINRFAQFELPNYNALAEWIQQPAEGE